MTHRWNCSGAMDKAGGRIAKPITGHAVKKHSDDALHSSGTPSYSVPLPSSNIHPVNRVNSIPIMFPSSPWTSEGSGTPATDDTSMSPSDMIPLLPYVDLPLLDIVPPHLMAYDDASPSHITYIPAPPPAPITHPSSVTRTQPNSPVLPIYSPTN